MSIRRHLIDATPLRRNAAFRAFWSGAAVSGFGGQMADFALLYYVWVLTGSAVMVGLVGVMRGVPLLVFGLLGGHLADLMNRRTLVFCARCCQLAVSVATAWLVISGAASIGVVLALIAAASAFAAVGAPASQTIATRLLGGVDLSAGLALMRTSSQIAVLAGPMAAGFLVAGAGIGACLVADAATFVAGLWGAWRVPAHAARPVSDGAAPVSGLAGLTGGIRFVLRTPVVLGAFLTDICAMVLAHPVALFPIINAERFEGSPITMGLMLPAIGLGGILAGILSGRVTHAPRQGLIMIASCAAYGAAAVAFGLSGNLPLALLALCAGGAADTFTVVSRATIVQSSTPDALRGRVNSLDYLVGAGGPSIGDLRAGLVASGTSGALSCVLGGVACVAGAGAIALTVPRLRSWLLGPAKDPLAAV